MIDLEFVFNKLDKDAIARVHCHMNVVLILKNLATLLFTKDKVNSTVHDQLLFQDIFDLFDFLYLVKVYRHFKLLVISTFDKTFGPYKSENYHSHILFFSILSVLLLL